MPTVALTGASGLVGGICREHWAVEPPAFASPRGGREALRLRLLDIAPLPEPSLRPYEEYRQVDITSLAELTAAFEGCEHVLHLAAYPGAGPGLSLSLSLSLSLALCVCACVRACARARACV